MDGLIVGIDLINGFCGTKKYKKRIFMITDGERETKCSKAEISSLIGQIQEKSIRLNVITLDFGNDLADESESDDETPQKPKKQ